VTAASARRPALLSARWLRLPRRTIRLRLTALYAALFLVSGAGLLTITYLLVANQAPGVQTGGVLRSSGGSAAGGCFGTGVGSPPVPGQLSPCAVLVQTQLAAQRAGYNSTLLLGSAVALAIMTVTALGLGWLVSGRVLSPLRTITWAARNISASNLHERLALAGPDDELKELGDTVDGLLARLECSFAAQHQFVANASHELRTPLARQRTLLEVALADPGRTAASLAAACERALAAEHQQERLIEALLTLARSQRGLDRCELVDLAALACDAAASRAADARHRGIAVSVQTGPAVFGGDARLAERLVANLLDNAIRHNQPGGQVLVQTGMAGPEAVVSVSNTGPVIRPADVGELFQPFRRGRARRTGDGDSPGLGLSIVGAIAAAHAARLGALAQPGGGLRIEVRFAAAAPVTAAQGHAAPGHAAPGQAGPVTISPSIPALRAG
jgi:signal transduction histidine kinase